MNVNLAPSLRDIAAPTLEAAAPVRPGDLNTPAGRHLVGLDIDGTTVHHDGTLTDAVRSAVTAAVAAGHDIVVATGRSMLAARPVIDALGLDHGYAVCSNGAVTLRLDANLPDGHEIVDTVTFDPTPVLRLLSQALPDALYAVERVGRGFDVSSHFPAGELDGDVREATWDDLVAEPTTRVTFASPGVGAEEFARAVESVGLHGVNYSVGFTAWLDITPDGVSKASALENVRRLLDVPPSRTVAVGDQRNDVEMLRWAACGVAMGNAPAEVAAYADVVTRHVEDDGLVDVLAALPAL